MIVISDTSPLCYLILIDLVEILPQLYGTVSIPEAVWRELSDERSPTAVKRWIAKPPAWLQVQIVLKPLDGGLEILGEGEQQAILLWEQLGADILVLDDREAREIARERGVAITGLLGLLDRAAELGLIDFAEAIDRLRQTTFRASSRLMEGLLTRHRNS